MARHDEEYLVKLSDDEVFDHLDDKDPRLVINSCCVLPCNSARSLSGHPTTEDDSDVVVDSFSGIHCHGPDLSLAIERRQAFNRLLSVALLCFLFMTAEWIGGYFANSLAIMSDAAHLLSDFGSFVVSLIAIRLSMRPATKNMTFGYHRTEVVGALVSVLVIWLVTGVLVFMAIERIRIGQYDVESDTMVVVASLGVCINIIMGIVLHGGCNVAHGHSHSSLGSGSTCSSTTQLVPPPPPTSSPQLVPTPPHSSAPHQPQSQPTPRNINVRAALVHVVGDLLQSVGVLIAALIIKWRPDCKIADPICTFVFSLIVLLTTCTVARDVFRILLEAAPRGISLTDVVGDICSVPGVLRVHSVNIWSLSVQRVAFTAHVVKKEDTDGEAVLSAVLCRLRCRHPHWSYTIQVESFQPTMDHCRLCQLPDI